MSTKLAVLFGLLLAPLPLLAHHAFAAEFDISKPVTVQGTVTKVEWANPHIWVYLDAKDDRGNVARWQCEGGSPNTLTRQGWKKDSLKQGDQVTIDGYRAKDGSHRANGRNLTLPGGETLFLGSSGTGAPEEKR